MNSDSAELKASLGRVLKSIRNKQGLSQATVSKDAEISRTYLAEVEGGDVNLTIETVLKICVALNVRPSVLFKKAGF
jgi:transcriptional regulator with XRE-family HTH domain